MPVLKQISPTVTPDAPMDTTAEKGPIGEQQNGFGALAYEHGRGLGLGPQRYPG